MRFQISLFALMLVAGTLVLPHFTHAAVGTFFGPIIPQTVNEAVCAAGFGLLMVVINRVIELALTIAIVFIAPIMIAYSGFLYVVNPVDPSGISKAKKILTNTVVGIVIALAAGMIVDAVMAALYNQGAHTPNGALGAWYGLITTNGVDCLDQKGSLPGDTLSQATIVGVGPIGDVLGVALAQCQSGNAACSPSALQEAGFTATQANVMSCIAVTENDGNAAGCTGNACGTFQIMLTVNQLVGPACGGTLDCPTLCKGNNGAAVMTRSCQPCVQAASNPQCNAQAAQHLYSTSGYGPWTTSSDNTKSAACINKYGGS